MTDETCYDGCCGRDPDYKTEFLGKTRFFCEKHAERFGKIELEKL